MSDIIYKFLPAEYGFKALESGRVKVSTQSELNDIYDFSLGELLATGSSKLGTMKADVMTSPKTSVIY